MRHRPRIAFLVLATVVASGCGRSGTDLPGDFLSVPGPDVRFPEFVPPTPVATPSGFPTDFGDGHDGPLSIAADTVVNSCVPVLNSGATSVSLTAAPPPAFVIGRRVLIHQVQDFSATSNDPTPVTAGIGGMWEMGRVASIAVNTLTLTSSLSMAYQTTSGRTAQICSVPEFSDITLTGATTDLLAPVWDGASGGILALFVSTSLNIGGGQLSARSGFRGGVVEGDSGDADVADDDTLVGSGRGGGKGEGLDGRSFAREGRGNYWNAGGGGNGKCGGGGGGGGAGAGGRGGTQKQSDGANSAVNGRPGSAVAFEEARLVFGGGGGAGQRESSGNAAGPGGTGGGAIVLFARKVVGDGDINASGLPGGDSTIASAGGGGAGGTVVLVVRDGVSTNVEVDVSGGRGGNHLSNDTRRGPGGGGGGGRAVVDLPGPMVIDTAGSMVGVNTNIASDPYEAEPGLPGGVLVLP